MGNRDLLEDLLSHLGRDPRERLTAEQLAPSLHGWKANLERLVRQEPDRWAPMMFRPPRDASVVLVNSHAKFPLLIERAIATLKFTEQCYSEFLDSRPNAGNNLIDAIDSLLDKVSVLADAVDVSGILENLNDRDRCILVELLKQRAVNGELVDGSEIVRRATGGSSFKVAFKDLIKKDLVASRPGRGGGYTLTESGTKVAVTLSV